MKFKYLEHTADCKFQAFGKTLEEAFTNSALAMSNVMHPPEKIKPKLAIITGFGIKMIQADPLYEAREIQHASKVQVIAARDGLSINPISYSATLRQKTLSLYK